MERMTDRYDGQAILICENEKCDKFDEIVCCPAAHPCEAEQNMIDLLAAYEDAEEQGLLVRLPCKVGTPVFKTFFSLDDEDYRKIVEERFSIPMVSNFGKTIFPTREEAEAELAKEG